MAERYLIRAWPRGRTHIAVQGSYWRHGVSTTVCGKRFSGYESDRLKDPTVLSGMTVKDRAPSCSACVRAVSA